MFAWCAQFLIFPFLCSYMDVWMGGFGALLFFGVTHAYIFFFPSFFVWGLGGKGFVCMEKVSGREHHMVLLREESH